MSAAHTLLFAGGAGIAGALAYAPAVRLLARAFGRDAARAPFAGRVAVIVPARDEAATIADKLANLVADSSLPPETEILVVADGCRDRTAEIARTSGRARVVEYSEPGGKARRFNALVPELEAEVVIFTDATARWSPGTAGRLLEAFADPDVGGAGAVLEYAADPASPVAGTTRRYFDAEAALRGAEGRLASSTGFSGSLYALRRAVFRPLAEHGNEDFQSALMVALAGRRAVIVEAARVGDDPDRSLDAELRMRRRVIGRSLRTLWAYRALLWRRPLVALLLVGHKLLRFLLPWSALLMLAGIFVAVYGELRLALIASTLAAIAAVSLAGAAAGWAPRSRWVRAVVHAAVVQAATVLAWGDVLLARVPAAWQPAREGRP